MKRTIAETNKITFLATGFCVNNESCNKDLCRLLSGGFHKDSRQKPEDTKTEYHKEIILKDLTADINYFVSHHDNILKDTYSMNTFQSIHIGTPARGILFE